MIRQRKYTSSRKLSHVNKSEPSTGVTKSYQPQLIQIEINSICVKQLYVELKNKSNKTFKNKNKKSLIQ